MDLRLKIILIVAMAIWGSTFVAMKVLVVSLPPMFVLFWRMLFAAGVFLLLWKWVARGNRYQSGDWVYFLLMGLFEPCLYFLFESTALQYTTAGQAGMVTALFPLLLVLAAYWFLAERISKWQILGLFLAVVGVLVMTAGSGELKGSPNPWLGNGLEAMAMASAIGYTLLVKKLSARFNPLFLTSLQAFVGVVFFGVLSLFEGVPEAVSVEQWILIFYLGVGATLGAYGLYNYVISKVDASEVAPYINLIPVFAVCFSVVLLGELLALIQLVAMFVVMLGVWLTTGKGRLKDQG